ncbi:MAG: transposase [Caldilineaceae bacterium]|nr:transposase [Caldilineaceae bacterium]
MTTPTAEPDPTTKPTAIRSERYRVRFDHRGQAELCAQTAGANRFVWNLFLAYNNWSYRMARKARGYGRWTDFPEAQRPLLVDPGRSWQSMYKRFAMIRSGKYDREFQAFLASPEGAVYADQDLSWLRDLPSHPVRHVLKYLDSAYRRFYKAHVEAKAEGRFLPRRKSDGKPQYFPRRKGRQGRKPDGFTIPNNVRMDGDRLHLPRMGWVRLERGRNFPYRGCAPKTVRLLKEGTDRHPKWYATVAYAVPTARLKPAAKDGELGVDRNVRQATDSEGVVYSMPDTSTPDANIRRKERKAAKARARSRQSGQPLSNRGRRICGQLRKLHRKKRRRRENAAHQHSRQLADTAHVVVIEDLNTQGMTQSAKGTEEKPGTNVKAKSGLNREILASGWGRLERNLDYKAGLVVRVDPAYTSQTCAACGHISKENRRTQPKFQCMACGHTANADHNAAINILARGLPLTGQARGAGASARREAIPLGTSTTREHGRRGPSTPVRSGPPGPDCVSVVNSSI